VGGRTELCCKLLSVVLMNNALDDREGPIFAGKGEARLGGSSARHAGGAQDAAAVSLKAVARRKKPIANQPIERAGPGLVGIAAHVRAHGRNGCS
jgi:hypothetical protein